MKYLPILLLLIACSKEPVKPVQHSLIGNWTKDSTVTNNQTVIDCGFTWFNPDSSYIDMENCDYVWNGTYIVNGDSLTMIETWGYSVTETQLQLKKNNFVMYLHRN